MWLSRILTNSCYVPPSECFGFFMGLHLTPLRSTMQNKSVSANMATVTSLPITVGTKWPTPPKRMCWLRFCCVWFCIQWVYWTFPWTLGLGDNLLESTIGDHTNWRLTCAHFIYWPVSSGAVRWYIILWDILAIWMGVDAVNAEKWLELWLSSNAFEMY